MAVTLSQKITLTDSANDWGLYDLQGSHAAAIEIDATLMNAVNSGADRATTRRLTLETMRRYTHLGSMDTEPLTHLIHILNQVYGREYSNQP